MFPLKASVKNLVSKFLSHEYSFSRLLGAAAYRINQKMKILQILNWNRRNYAPPAPHFIKQKVIVRHAIRNSVFIETGTLVGETTKLLSKISNSVITIEPSDYYFNIAYKNLKAVKNVIVINSSSELSLDNIISQLPAESSVNFWLDGHYSEGKTFQGTTDTPILIELATIEKHFEKFDKVVVLIDDVRLFQGKYSLNEHYPDRSFLVSWADRNSLQWSIELDIFIAKSL